MLEIFMVERGCRTATPNKYSGAPKNYQTLRIGKLSARAKGGRMRAYLNDKKNETNPEAYEEVKQCLDSIGPVLLTFFRS